MLKCVLCLGYNCAGVQYEQVAGEGAPSEGALPGIAFAPGASPAGADSTSAMLPAVLPAQPDEEAAAV